jgi:hypothetical protein
MILFKNTRLINYLKNTNKIEGYLRRVRYGQVSVDQITYAFLVVGEKTIYYLNLAPTIYCGVKRLTTILCARFRY